MSTTAATMAAIASSQAALAARYAQEAKCQGVLPNFKAQTATVAEMQEYAECVRVLYPQAMEDGTTLLLKVLFVVALLGLVGGATKAWRNGEGVEGAVMFGFICFVGAPLAVASVVGLVLGVQWVFS